MDIETLIFIILTVIGLLVSVFGKKKKLFDPGEAETESFPAFPEGEYYPGEFAREQEDGPVEEEMEPEMKGEENHGEEKTPEMITEKEKILQEENTIAPRGNPLLKVSKNFNLREAVIYSEILQRKYF